MYQVYSHINNHSIFEDYPIAKAHMYHYLWNTLPDTWGWNYEDGGNYKWGFIYASLNLFNSTEQKEMWTLYQRIMNAEAIRPAYTRIWDGTFSYVSYWTYPDLSTIPYAYPSWTTHLSQNASIQTLRQSWNDNSPWMSFITSNYTSDTARSMQTDDQLSFDYYDKNNYIIADVGEVKYRSDYGIDPQLYGGIMGKAHNILMFSNTGSNMGAAYKSNASVAVSAMDTPAKYVYGVSSNSVDAVSASVDIKKIEETDSTEIPTGNLITLSNPLYWKRSIVFPKDYFIVFDYVNNSEANRKSIH